MVLLVCQIYCSVFSASSHDVIFISDGHHFTTAGGVFFLREGVILIWNSPLGPSFPNNDVSPVVDVAMLINNSGILSTGKNWNVYYIKSRSEIN